MFSLNFWFSLYRHHVGSFFLSVLSSVLVQLKNHEKFAVLDEVKVNPEMGAPRLLLSRSQRGYVARKIRPQFLSLTQVPEEFD